MTPVPDAAAGPPGAGRPRAARKFWMALVAIALVGLSVRVGLALEVRDHHAFGYDATWFHTVANHLADGDGFVVDRSVVVRGLPLAPHARLEPTALFPPAYPGALAIGSLVGMRSLFQHQLWSTLLGAGTVVLIGLLGRRVGGRSVGLTAASIAALHPLLVGADIALMSESLYGSATVALLLIAYRAADRPTVGGWIALGAAGAVVSLTRNEGVVLAGTVVLAAAWCSTASAPHRRLKLAGVAFATLALLLAPWVIRNNVKVDSTTLATNAGATVAGANCPTTYDGPMLGSWDFGCLDLSRWESTGQSEAQFYDDLLDRGLDYARGHMSRAPVVVAARLGRVVGIYRPVQELDFAENEGRHRPVQLLGTAADVALIGLSIGGVMLLRRRRVAIAPLLAPVVVVLAAAVLHGNPRVRFAAEPAIVVGAAVALVAVGQRIRRRPLVPSAP